MSEVLKRPIVQCTYPHYPNGRRKDLSIKPDFTIKRFGLYPDKKPIFIHYNGINHFNACVPRDYKETHEPKIKSSLDLPEIVPRAKREVIYSPKRKWTRKPKAAAKTARIPAT